MSNTVFSRHAALILASGLFATSVASANGTLELPYGDTEEEFDNVICSASASITGVGAAGDQISGTNVRLNLSIGARFNENNSFPETYDDAKFYRAILTINGEEIYDRTYEVSSGGGGGMGGMSINMFGGPPFGGLEFPQDAAPPSLRFASNHYAHETTVGIVLETHFKLYKFGVWIQTGVVTANIAPKAKNRMAMWKSAYNSDGEVWNSGAAIAIRMLMTKARAELAAAKFGYDNNNQDHPKSVALNDIGDSSSAFINAHGTADDLGDWSAGHYGGHSEIHWMTWAEIGTALDGQLCQWVFLYACDTGISSSAILGAFNVPAVDGAYLGFGVALTAFATKNSAPNGTPVGFDNQAQYLFDRLKEGYAIEDALQLTNSEPDGYRCLNAAESPINMIMAGDALTTWTSVYLYEDGTAFSRSNLADAEGRFTAWHIILE